MLGLLLADRRHRHVLVVVPRVDGERRRRAAAASRRGCRTAPRDRRSADRCARWRRGAACRRSARGRRGRARSSRRCGPGCAMARSRSRPAISVSPSSTRTSTSGATLARCMTRGHAEPSRELVRRREVIRVRVRVDDVVDADAGLADAARACDRSATARDRPPPRRRSRRTRSRTSSSRRCGSLRRSCAVYSAARDRDTRCRRVSRPGATSTARSRRDRAPYAPRGACPRFCDAWSILSVLPMREERPEQ